MYCKKIILHNTLEKDYIIEVFEKIYVNIYVYYAKLRKIQNFET